MQDAAAQPVMLSLAFGCSAVGTHAGEVAVERVPVDPEPLGDVSHAVRASGQQRNRVWCGKRAQSAVKLDQISIMGGSVSLQAHATH